MFFLLRSEIRFRTYRLELCLPPPFFRLVSDVHELNAKCTTVGLAQILQHFAKRHTFLAEIGIAGVKDNIHVGIREPVKGGLKIGKCRSLLTFQGIKICPA